jgi:hypothetical protein
VKWTTQHVLGMVGITMMVLNAIMLLVMLNLSGALLQVFVLVLMVQNGRLQRRLDAAEQLLQHARALGEVSVERVSILQKANQVAKESLQEIKLLINGGFFGR